MRQPESCTLQVPGLTLHANAWGPRDGLRVLALHGWLDNAESFTPLAPHLPSCRLVALDLPGHGLSDHRPPAAGYHFVDWVPDVVAAADALGWDRFILMGHSMGAGIGCLLAGAFPERVSKLVLLEGLGPMTSEAEEMPERLAAHVRERQRMSGKGTFPYPSREAVAERLSRMVPNLTLDAARLLVGRNTREVPGGITWRSDPRLRGTSAMRLTEAQVLAFLRRIICPTLLLRADDGYAFDPVSMAARCQSIAHLQLVQLAGGHHVHMDAPAQVAGLLGRFLGDGDGA